MHYTKKDFRVDWFSGTGAGGQYRNKHRNCCRITHLETGLVATGQSHRERPANQREAFLKLVSRIRALSEVPEERRRQSNVVRTYHFERGIAFDGQVTQPIARTMDGEITPFIEAALLGARPERGTGRA